jgi:HTH-type transcriptional regulator/antitoxin HigA
MPQQRDGRMTAVVSGKIDSRKYGRLLAKTLPAVIETEKEYERLLAEVKKLLRKGERISAEEEKLLDLMSVLIENYEDEHHPIPDAPPHAVLQMLMEDRNLRQKDRVHLLGSSGVASEAINGKRSISKTQAKALGKFFNVSPELFI